MIDDTLITKITEWLVEQSLGSPDINAMFQGMCERINASGIPVSRAMITYQTLHPVIQIEMAVWKKGAGVEIEQYAYRDDEPEAWTDSPLKFMLDSSAGQFRRRLTGPEATLDYPVLTDFADGGYTDYFAMATTFSVPGSALDNSPRGILVSWCSDRPSGFSGGDIAALERIQRRFAVACKTAIQSSIARNIAVTYLGESAAERVLSGQIRRGDGAAIRAVVWFCDIHGSTHLADTMPREDFLELLNDYYECTAGAVIDAGGEVLDFIGDAVLAIFPVERDADIPNAAKTASTAVQDALARGRTVNGERVLAGKPAFEFAVALNLGEVMFGNIGVSRRLSFSVIGPTVNEVARIEKLTREHNAPALAAESVACAAPDYWHTPTMEHLVGVAEPVRLYGWAAA